jgi:hypothetical protein
LLKGYYVLYLLRSEVTAAPKAHNRKKTVEGPFES